MRKEGQGTSKRKIARASWVTGEGQRAGQGCSEQAAFWQDEGFENKKGGE